MLRGFAAFVSYVFMCFCVCFAFVLFLFQNNSYLWITINNTTQHDFFCIETENSSLSLLSVVTPWGHQFLDPADEETLKPQAQTRSAPAGLYAITFEFFSSLMIRAPPRAARFDAEIAGWPYGCPKRWGNVREWTKTFSALMTTTIFYYTSSPAGRGACA